MRALTRSNTADGAAARESNRAPVGGVDERAQLMERHDDLSSEMQDEKFYAANQRCG
jgi:hypothetical protein